MQLLCMHAPNKCVMSTRVVIPTWCSLKSIYSKNDQLWRRNPDRLWRPNTSNLIYTSTYEWRKLNSHDISDMRSLLNCLMSGGGALPLGSQFRWPSISSRNTAPVEPQLSIFRPQKGTSTVSTSQILQCKSKPFLASGSTSRRLVRYLPITQWANYMYSIILALSERVLSVANMKKVYILQNCVRMWL